ncbi:MAG: hypothetical protein P8Z30_07320 [Acidobacteriota bacterium]
MKHQRAGALLMRPQWHPARDNPMKKARTAREMEIAAAAARPPRPQKVLLPAGEAMAMLARRGLRPGKARFDIPFPEHLEQEKAEQLAELLGHYSFRLFLRGAILHPEGFVPEEVTQYLKKSKSKAYAEALVKHGFAERTPPGHYRLLRAAKSFGGTLEWYVARELGRRFGFDVAAGVRFHAHGVGGDLDVVAAAEGKLAYLELKSSPPKNLEAREVAAFFDRVQLVRPDIVLFVVDTALRLSDKVLPMLVAELERRRGGASVVPRRIERELWALTPHLYAVNGKLDLITNIGRALAEGLLALAPPL